MGIIKELGDSEVFNKKISRLKNYSRIRETSRGVLINDKNELLLIYLPNLKLYKLPGGEKSLSENIEDCFTRNVLEETGFTCGILRYIGRIIEYKNKYSQVQISHCFIGKAEKGRGLIKRKKENGQEKIRILWVDFREAIRKLEESSPLEYTPKFIRLRDLNILIKCKEYLFSKRL